MKKVLSLVLALLLVLSLTSAFAEDAPTAFTLGRLALNACFEEEANASLANGSAGPDGRGAPQVKFFDSLDAMILALYRGDIGQMVVDRYVADYILGTNEDLQEIQAPDFSGDMQDAQIPAASELFPELSYSFGFMEDREDLKSKFDQALAKIIEDGTLSWLKYQLIDMDNDLEAMDPVEMPFFPGAETIVIAVTGDVPPMDYVAADGTPRGFNVALLAELSRHMETNIEIMQVSSGARAIALQTGRVDALFWTATVSETYDESLNFMKYGDIAEGMILSIPYLTVPEIAIMLADAE